MYRTELGRCVVLVAWCHNNLRRLFKVSRVRMRSAFTLPPFAISPQENRIELPQINTNRNTIVSYPISSPDQISNVQRPDRLTILEWRISVQDTITVNLLDKIATVRGEMLEHLKLCRNLEKEQAMSKDRFSHEFEMLSESIKNMNKGIQASGRFFWMLCFHVVSHEIIWLMVL